ncbi:MAG TPA: hypothetical protein VF906_05995 [Candidatus Bathyarchaeia archaeon]
MWATLLSDSPKIVVSVNTDFVVSVAPPQCKIYFAAATEYENDFLKPLLDANKDFYLEKSDLRGETPAILGKRHPHRGLTDFLIGREAKGREKWRFIYASTQSREVIGNIFEHYQFEYGSLFNFPFIISKDEPREWIKQFEGFFVGVQKGEFAASVIEESHCVMATYWEHGMECVSNKITRAEITEIAHGIADKHSLSLAVKD